MARGAVEAPPGVGDRGDNLDIGEITKKIARVA